MVSLIQSNYRGMGSGITPTGTGFVLQNRGELFALDDEHMNRYEPGKRPFHTIIPAFVTKDGQPVMSYDVMGGATQPQMHAQILIKMLDFGMNLQEAVGPYGGYQAIWFDADNQVYIGASESRKDGHAAGY